MGNLHPMRRRLLTKRDHTLEPWIISINRVKRQFSVINQNYQSSEMILPTQSDHKNQTKIIH